MSGESVRPTQYTADIQLSNGKKLTAGSTGEDMIDPLYATLARDEFCALRGAGDTAWPLAFTFLGFVGVRLPLAWMLAIHWQWGIAGAWYAMVAPPKTPAAIVNQISQAIAEVLRIPEIVGKLRAMFISPMGLSPGDTVAFLRQEAERYRQIIVSAGIKAD